MNRNSNNCLVLGKDDKDIQLRLWTDCGCRQQLRPNDWGSSVGGDKKKISGQAEPSGLLKKSASPCPAGCQLETAGAGEGGGEDRGKAK